VVGTDLRRFRVSDYHLQKATMYQNRLEELEHLVEDGEDREAIRRQALAVSRAYSLLSRAFRHEPLD
jgi:hypothetical protein